MLTTPRESICCLIMSTGAILNLILITHQVCEGYVLLGCLYHLRQQFFQAFVVCNYGQAMAKQVLPPLLHRCCNRELFADIGRGTEQHGRERLAEEGYGVVSLGQHYTHTYPQSVCFNGEGKVKIRQGKDKSLR